MRRSILIACALTLACYGAAPPPKTTWVTTVADHIAVLSSGDEMLFVGRAYLHDGCDVGATFNLINKATWTFAFQTQRVTSQVCSDSKTHAEVARYVWVPVKFWPSPRALPSSVTLISSLGTLPTRVVVAGRTHNPCTPAANCLAPTQAVSLEAVSIDASTMTIGWMQGLANCRDLAFDPNAKMKFYYALTSRKVSAPGVLCASRPTKLYGGFIETGHPAGVTVTYGTHPVLTQLPVLSQAAVPLGTVVVH